MLKPLLFGLLSGAIALSAVVLISTDYHPRDNGGPGTSQSAGTRLYHRASGR